MTDDTTPDPVAVNPDDEPDVIRPSATGVVVPDDDTVESDDTDDPST